MRVRKLSLVAVTVLSLVTLAPAHAQGGGFARPSISVQAFNACTTTDYADLVAKALGKSVVDVRMAIVSGETLQEFVQDANWQAAVTAYQTARKADIDQAVKDGVISQDEATNLETPATPSAATPAAGGGFGGNGGGRGGAAGLANAPFPDINNIRTLLGQATPAAGGARGAAAGGGGIGLGLNLGIFNAVKQYEVAAQALNMKCTDLVKTLITPPGKALASLAADQNVDITNVSDALVKAYSDALAQDVADGVITQADSDQLTPLIATAAKTFINNPLPMGPQVTPTPAS